jgi:microcystin-dependent protein
LATTSSTFHNSLRLQVDGLVGATKYCDVTGANCFTAASTSAIIASGGGGGPVSTSTGGFGAWESKTTGTVYQALTDGFVVAMADGPSGSGYIYGYTDSSPAPSTAVMWSSDQWSDQKGGVTFPVRKNDYWKVTTTFWATVYWLPQTSGGSSGSSPVGTVSQFAGSSVPGGYLECNGTAVSRATFSALFAVIGTTYGAGDGSTTFNLPNLKGKIPVGMDTSQTEFDVLGETGGEKAHTLTVAEMPSHNHNSAQNGPGGGGVVVANTGNQSWVFPTSYTGSDQPHNNLQPYVVMKYIIKY